MARIRQDNARKVSVALVKKFDEQIAKERAELKAYITEIVKATVPVEVMRQFKRGKKWLKTSTTVYLDGQGITNSYESTAMEELPVDTSGYNRIQLKPKQADEYVARKNRIKDLQNKKDSTQEEIYNLLLALGTWKKALVELPQIKPYVPDTEKREIMIIPEQTKAKIARLISVTDNKCLETI